MTEMEMLTRDRDEALTEIEQLNLEYDTMQEALTIRADKLQKNLDEVAEDYNKLSDRYTELYNKRWRAENTMILSLGLNIILVAIIIRL